MTAALAITALTVFPIAMASSQIVSTSSPLDRWVKPGPAPGDLDAPGESVVYASI